MQGLGNYIHARGENYLKYGTGYKEYNGMNLESAVNAAHQDMLTNLQKTRKMANMQELSNFLTALVYHKDVGYSGDLLSIDANQIAQLEEQFTQLIEAKYPQLEANLNNLTFENAISAGTDASKMSIDTKTGVQKGTIVKARAQVEKIINNIVKIQNRCSKEELETLRLEAVSIANRMDALIAENESKSAATSIKSTATGGSDYDLLLKYNALIKSAQAPTKEQMGTLAEAYFAFMISAANNVVVNSTEKLFDDLVYGMKSSQNVIRNIPTSIGADLAMKMNTSIKEDGKMKTLSGNQMHWNWDESQGTITWTGESQGTVDIKIDFPDDSILSNKFGTDGLNASVKNYGSIQGWKGEGVHIVRGYPLLSALMLFNVDFSNHYLNLLAAHDDNVNFAVPKEVEDTIIKGIAMRALSGARDIDNLSGNLLSDVFIVNERSAQRVLVYTTQDLVSRIWSNLEEYINVSGLPQNHVPMTWGGDGAYSRSGAEIRISNLLANVHAFKISMSLKPATF